MESWKNTVPSNLEKNSWSTSYLQELLPYLVNLLHSQSHLVWRPSSCQVPFLPMYVHGKFNGSLMVSSVSVLPASPLTSPGSTKYPRETARFPQRGKLRPPTCAGSRFEQRPIRRLDPPGQWSIWGNGPCSGSPMGGRSNQSYVNPRSNFCVVRWNFTNNVN